MIRKRRVQENSSSSHSLIVTKKKFIKQCAKVKSLHSRQFKTHTLFSQVKLYYMCTRCRIRLTFSQKCDEILYHHYIKICQQHGLCLPSIVISIAVHIITYQKRRSDGISDEKSRHPPYAAF